MTKKRCRLCAETKEEDYTLLTDELELIVKIRKLFHIQIELDDKLPIDICTSCECMVNKMWEFNEIVHKAQEMLRSIEESKNYDSTTDEEIVRKSSMKNKTVKRKKKQKHAKVCSSLSLPANC